jgi:hypothetical protein
MSALARFLTFSSACVTSDITMLLPLQRVGK